MDFILEDLSVEYNGVAFSLSIESEKISSSFAATVSLKFGKAFPILSQKLCLTVADVEVLKQQIDDLSRQSGGISLLEPEFYMQYVKCDGGRIELFIIIDSGFANSNMGTDSGPALRMLTTELELKKWINKIAQYVDHHS